MKKIDDNSGEHRGFNIKWGKKCFEQCPCLQHISPLFKMTLWFISDLIKYFGKDKSVSISMKLDVWCSAQQIWPCNFFLVFWVQSGP